MATDLSSEAVAGVLDQLYRAARGLRRRFQLRSEELRVVAGRERSLRPKFFEQLAWDLEYRHSILMSYPRLGRGGTLGFASSVIAERWQAAPEDNVQNAL